MAYSIIPYDGDSPMRPWPSLAARAFFLKDDLSSKDSIFFYDFPWEKDSGSAPLSVVVLIHGLGDEADSWRHLIPLLNARGYRVLALDLCGFGRSAASGKINIKKHAEAVIRLLEAVIGPSPHPARVFLAGNSMGTMIAELVAIKRPRLVQGLILIDGSIPGGPSNPGLLVLARLLFDRTWYRAYRNDPERARASLFPYYADFDALPQEDKEFLRQRVMDRVESPAQERAFFATQRDLIRTYLTGVSRFKRGMQSYKGKILLIWGEKDRIIPVSSADVFMSLRPDAKLEIIHGAGHLPHQEKPEETARIMAEFAQD